MWIERVHLFLVTISLCFTINHADQLSNTSDHNNSLTNQHPNFCADGCLNDTKLSSVNKVNLTALGLDNQVDGKGVGIDLTELGNVTEIEEILANDTGVGILTNVSQLDDRRAVPGSVMIAVMKKVKYDANAAPLIVESKETSFRVIEFSTEFSGMAVQVKMGVAITSISDFKDDKMEFSLLLQLRMQWRDFRLKHTFYPYVLIKEKNITDQIWRPDPYFVNEKEAKMFSVSYPNMRMSVFPDGLVSYMIRLRIKPSCQMSFCRFPQDRQICDLKISSMAYPRDMVEFSWFDDNPVEMSEKIKLPELQLKDYSSGYCAAKGSVTNNSCLRVVFDMQRSPASHVLRKFIPSFTALLFAWAGAYVPQHFGDIRIVAPVTILLTLKQLERSNDDLPTTSYLTSLDIWFTVVETFTVMALIETMLVYGVSKRIKAYRKLASYASTETAKRKFEERANRAERYSTLLDYTSRFLFPFLFAIFVVVYATAIATGKQDYCLS